MTLQYGDRIQDRTCGRWHSLLPMLGVETRHLNGKHGPCPLCGGKDRFRFDDKGGNGTWFCSHCGAGNGVDLVMKIKNIPFLAAKQEIEKYIGAAPAVVPRATKSDVQKAEMARDQMAALWGRACPLDGEDIASRYLAWRGVILTVWPASIRVIEDLPYYDETKSRSLHPGMLAKFAAADGKSAILHRTYLAEPGRKASVEKPRMLMPGKVPPGGAVRLSAPAETMGIAEGIETALSASIIFGIPVWAALTAGALMKWQPPKEAKCVFVFGDNDKSLAGQNAAYALGYRLKTENFQVEMRFPEDAGTDWNDELAGSMAPATLRSPIPAQCEETP